MEIIKGTKSGFCGGVKNAVAKAQEALLTGEKIYCLGELVHNADVIGKLTQAGMQEINSIEEAPTGAKIIIRAHGVPKQIYEIAKKRNCFLLDLTCPKVLSIHRTAEQESQKECYLFLIGEKQHPETIGTISYCGEESFVIEDIEQVPQAIECYKKSAKSKISILVQTTFSLDKFEKIVEAIKLELRQTPITVNNTICNATAIRQKETQEIANNPKVECMIIIGGKNSANTKKLWEISRESGKTAIFVQSEKDIDETTIIGYNIIGVVAGASTPQENIDEVVNALRRVGSYDIS